LEKTDAQFDIASKGFKIIEVKVIKRKLNAGNNQYGFQDKVFIVIEICGVTKKTEVSPKDHHPPDENTFQKEESNFACGYILVKDSKDHISLCGVIFMGKPLCGNLYRVTFVGRPLWGELSVNRRA
jgi:hypothetical protein